MISYENWFKRLLEYPELVSWVEEIEAESQGWFSNDVRADLEKWKSALKDLPEVETPSAEIVDGRLMFSPATACDEEVLRQFHPWRKGPLQIGETFIDTEWRSDWKWERVESNISLAGKTVLDIGCGNGYYLWRMLLGGAKWALGIDPYLPYAMQFLAMQHFAGENQNVGILPVGVERLPRVAPCFDVVFSMGVLYHQKSPLEHLAHMRDLTSKGGEVIVETIVLPAEFEKVTDCLVPEGRYAKMKNVNFLPSVAMLESWMRKLRFKDVEVLDFVQTTGEEQRSTDWMTFESLPNFLDPDDSNKTIEGYPAPWRVVVKAKV